MSVICLLISMFVLVLLARMALSWFPASRRGLLASAQDVTARLTEWCLGPLRRAIRPVRIGAVSLDLSPLLLILGLQLLQAAICSPLR